MTKTIKQIADELGVDKQRVYRYIKKNRINEAHHESLQKNGVKQYDEAAETLIKQGLLHETTSGEVHPESHNDVLQNHINDTVSDAVIDMLRKELDIKNKQIEELNARLAEISSALVMAQQTAQAAQALHAGTMQKQLIEEITDPAAEQPQKEEKKSWFGRLFGKQN